MSHLKNKNKDKRLTLRLEDGLLKKILEYKYGHDIPGSVQQTVIRLIRIAIQLDEYTSQIQKDPTFIQKLKDIKLEGDIIDILHDKCISIHDLQVCKSAIETLLVYKTYNIR